MNQISICEQQENCTIIGPLTFDTVQSAARKCRKLLPKNKCVLFDLSGVTECDSASLAFIIAMMREGRLRNLKISFKGVSQQLSDLIRVGGLDSIMPISAQQ